MRTWRLGFFLFGLVFGFGIGSQIGFSADVVGHFLTPDLDADGVFTWDDFNPAIGFPGMHVPASGFSSGTGIATLQPTTGGIITASLNLYAFTATPTYTFSVTGAAVNEAITHARLQLASTQLLNSSSFLITPDSFISRGPLSQLAFGGNPVDVNYYDVRWNNLAPAANLSIATAPAEMHSVLGGARFEYSNASTVPEPSSGFLVLIAAIVGGTVRRVRPSRSGE